MASGERVSVPEFGIKQDGVDYIDRPGVYALIENKDKQVAVIETRMGHFLPGGGIDAGETDTDDRVYSYGVSFLHRVDGPPT